MSRIARLLLVLAPLVVVAAPARAQWLPDGAPVCSAAGDQTAPAIVRSGGGAIVVWRDARGATTRVYAQRLNGAGVPLWTTNGIEVSAAAGAQTSPVAVPDGGGGVIVAWVQTVNGDDDIYAQRLSSAGARQWGTSGVAVCDVAGAQSAPAMISDGLTSPATLPGAILAWTDARVPGDLDIWAQAIGTNGARRWAAAGVSVCQLTGRQSDVTMVTDGTGPNLFSPRGAIFAWRDERDTPGVGHVYAQRMNGSGVTQWITNGIGLAPQTPEQKDVRLAYVGSASAIAVWSDGRSVGRFFDLFAQKVGGNAIAWGPTGVRVCDVDATKNSPAIVHDGAGGAFLAWRDQRTFLDPDLFAQHLDANGVRLLSATGAAVVNGLGAQATPLLVTPAADRALVAWADNRADAGNVFAQSLDFAATPLWAAGGVPLTQAAGQQYQPVAVVDSTGGALVAWVDYRNGNADVWANVVLGSGGVADADGVTPMALRCLPPRPQPSAGRVTIAFELPRDARVTLAVHDVTGRRVRDLLPGHDLPAGRHEATWDGRDERGAAVPPGVYWARLEAAGAVASRRIVRLDR